MLKADIIKKANEIIDITKHEQEKYHDERILIFNLLKKCDDEENIRILESVIKIFEKNQKIEHENERYRSLGLEYLGESIKNQKIRKEDGKIKGFVLFVIEDDEKNEYSFYSRENAQRYIDTHREKFNKNKTIKRILKNENIDFQELVKKIINENESK